MIHKMNTWLRIQQRVAKIYLVDVLDFLEWPIRLLLNWIIFVTVPLWLWFFIVHGVLWRAIAFHRSAERDALTGKIWFWEMFKPY